MGHHPSEYSPNQHPVYGVGSLKGRMKEAAVVPFTINPSDPPRDFIFPALVTLGNASVEALLSTGRHRKSLIKVKSMAAALRLQDPCVWGPEG